MSKAVSKWKAVSAATRQFRDEVKVPASAFTIAEYAEQYGMSEKGAEHQLQRCCRDGILQTAMKSVQSPTGLRKRRFFWVA